MRYRVRCDSATKTKGYGSEPFVYDYEFSIIKGGPDDQRLVIPNGTLRIGAVLADLYEPDDEYILELAPARKARKP